MFGPAAIFLQLFLCGCILLSSCYAETKCRSPSGSWGSCVLIYDCEPLLDVIRNKIERNYRFVRLSQCQTDTGEFHKYVCCTNETQFEEKDWQDTIIFPDASQKVDETANTAKSVRSEDKFPKPPNCGGVTVGRRIFGGVEVDLTEYSWMVNLEYRNGSYIQSNCAGSMINERYVLTAAHCVKDKNAMNNDELVSVRLGVHNTDYDVDSIAPSQRSGIESITVHELFDVPNALGVRNYHDIALIRLNRAINFTDFIQPVCLPGVESVRSLDNSGEMLTVAGWGHTGDARRSANKLKVSLPLVDNEKCRRIVDEKIRRKPYIADEQICAGGNFREDSCTGDSGGPLMRYSKGLLSWVIEGIVSYGFGCGREVPAVYTRVNSYLDWIEKNVVP